MSEPELMLLFGRLFGQVDQSPVAVNGPSAAHSEQRLTADLYGHLLEETAATAAGHMDRLLAAK